MSPTHPPIGCIITFLLLLFFLAETLKVPYLNNFTLRFTERNPATAILGVTLLAADVLIPVPSSVVMTANGLLFGVVVGSFLSLSGGLCSALLGFSLGKWGAPQVRRIVRETEWDKTEGFVARWGVLAVIISGPVPILAETVAIIAGTSSMAWHQMAFSAALGLLPTVLLYSFSGSFGIMIGSPFAAFFLSIIIAGAFWRLGKG